MLEQGLVLSRVVVSDLVVPAPRANDKVRPMLCQEGLEIAFPSLLGRQSPARECLHSRNRLLRREQRTIERQLHREHHRVTNNGHGEWVLRINLVAEMDWRTNDATFARNGAVCQRKNG